MPEAGPRYAIYFVPASETDLYKFGTSIIGYDCYAGRDAVFADGIDPTEWAPAVRSPRAYGFHATLKAPFYLTDGFDEGELCRALQEFAGAQAAIRVRALAVRELETFVALVSQTDCSMLGCLAHRVVDVFDRFRAPLNENDRRRRAVSGLTTRQRENLERWGYPYVGDDFRFHMTLTGSLGPAERQRALSFLRHKFEMITGPVTVNQISVLRQSDNATPFHVLHTASLGYSPYRPFAYSC